MSTYSRLPKISNSASHFITDSISNLSTFDKYYFLVTTGILAFSVAFIKDIVELRNSAPLIILIISWILISLAIALILYTFYLFGHLNKEISLIIEKLQANYSALEIKLAEQETNKENNKDDTDLKEFEILVQQTNETIMEKAMTNNSTQGLFRLTSMILFSLGILAMLLFVSWSLTKEKKVKLSVPAEVKDSTKLYLSPDTLILRLENTGISIPSAPSKPESVSLIHFDFDKWDLHPENFTILNELITRLKKDSKTVVKIGGHTDYIGSEKYNQWLSKERADIVTNYLTKQNIDRNRIITKSYGSYYPIDDNISETGRKNNRRTELSLSE